MKSQSIYISCAENLKFIFDRIFVKLAGYQDGIKSREVQNSGRIGSVTLEVRALERRKNSIYILKTFKHEYLLDQSASFGQILCVASKGWLNGCI